MLNAFRHQRKERGGYRKDLMGFIECSTPFGINGRNAHSTPSVSLMAQSAQRLSASTEGTHWPGPPPTDCPRVLNAFRHQRKERYRRRGNRCRRPYVLNAFRHQRKERSMLSGFYFQNIQCSTPFGINGRNALWPAKTMSHWCGVLNAFRHQRKERSQLGGGV